MKKLIAFVAFAFALGSISAFAAEDMSKDNMKSDKPAAAAKKKSSKKAAKKAPSKQSAKKDAAPEGAGK